MFNCVCLGRRPTNTNLLMHNRVFLWEWKTFLLLANSLNQRIRVLPGVPQTCYVLLFHAFLEQRRKTCAGTLGFLCFSIYLKHFTLPLVVYLLLWAHVFGWTTYTTGLITNSNRIWGELIFLNYLPKIDSLIPQKDSKWKNK